MLRPYAGRTAKTGFVEVFSNFLYNKDMRIGQRLGLGFGIILLLTIGISTFIFFSLQRIQKLQKVVAIHTSNIENVEDLNFFIQQWLMTVEDILKKRDLSQLDYHEILEATIEKELDEIDWNIYGNTTGNLRDEITQAFNSIEKLDNAVQMYIRLGSKVSEAINIDDALNVFEENATRLARIVDNLKETVTESYKQTISHTKRMVGNCWLTIYMVGSTTIIFSIIYAYITTRCITKPLYLLSMMTKQMTDSPHEAKLDIKMKSPFEIERLIDDFNDMSMKLNESKNKLAHSYKIIEEQKNFYDTILSNTMDSIFVMNKENIIEYMNHEASRIHGHAIGKYCCKVICNQETACQQCGIKEVSNGLTLKIERTIKGKVYESHIIPFKSSGKDISKMEILRDITERKQYQNELERLSITDKLTGLYNRRYFDEALEKEVLRARRFKHDLSLMFIDIDNFKHFNDTYGHTEGDAVLQRIGLLIKEQVRNEIDIACRYGGEEFTIILPETASSSATAIADRLIRDFKSIKFHIPSKNETIQKTISIGIADVNVSNNAKVLLDNADKAMYEAKKLGGNKVCEYRA